MWEKKKKKARIRLCAARLFFGTCETFDAFQVSHDDARAGQWYKIFKVQPDKIACSPQRSQFFFKFDLQLRSRSGDNLHLSRQFYSRFIDID